MKYFEMVYKEMERLLIYELPETIRKLNEEKNDGLIISPFSNKTLQDKNLQAPYFTFAISHSEKTSKDILIENVVFKCEIEVHLNETDRDYQLKLWRYFAAVERLIEDNGASDFWQSAKVSDSRGSKIFIRVVV